MDSNALIEAVRRHPSLYSKKHSSSNNADQKNTIWCQIAVDMNQSVEKCKAKWRNLRDAYQKSVKWRRELDTLGKLSSYHEYKHEAAMSFLEVGTKRKSNYERESQRETRSSKVPRVELDHEAVYIESQDAVEYLVETDGNERPLEYEEDEMSIHSNFVDDLQEYHSQNPKIEVEDAVDQEFLHYEPTINPTHCNTVASSQNDDVPYQESFINESQMANSLEIDSWLSSIKETLLSFPKLTRARVKKQINDLVSEFEIKYLESIESDRR